MAQLSDDFDGRAPLVLTVPGLSNSGPGHWQTLWEQSRDDCSRVDLGQWDAPHRNSWVTKLDQAVRNSPTPVILVAHSLGCHAVAWWAALSGQPYGWPVAGALLVAPPDVTRAGIHPGIKDFAPMAPAILPFPAILVASEDDHYASIQASFDMARHWGCHFENAGALGHINADSDIGFWADGQRLLDRVMGAAHRSRDGQAVSGIEALRGPDPYRTRSRAS